MPDAATEDVAAEAAKGNWFSPESAVALETEFKSNADRLAGRPSEDKPRGADGKFLPANQAPPVPPAQTPPAAPSDPKALPPLDKYVPGQTKSAQWDAIKAERDAAKAEAEAARRERDELKSKTTIVDPKQFDDVRRERDEYVTRLREVAIERDPAFIADYERNKKVIEDGARMSMGVLGESILKALDLSPEARDAAIEAALKDVSETRRPFIIAAAVDAQTKMAALRSARDNAISERKSNWEKYQTESRTAEAAQIRQERERSEASLNAQIQKWQDAKEGLAILQPREGDAAWNSEVSATIKRSKDILSGNLSPEAMADAALRAASFHSLLQSHNALATRLSEYEAKLQELGALEPGAGGNGEGGGGLPSGDEIKPTGNYGQDIAAAAMRSGVALGN